MKSINLIIPYFGEFPNYFPLFLKSCEFNKTIDWTIITDNRVNYEYPTNVHKIDMSFRELKIRIQSKVQFSISLEEPYKLCDFRPAYGFLFPEIVDGYDYWGYCDVDVIFGDIRKFLTDDILKYPKLFELGHFTLIKNNIFYNEMFMRHINNQLYYKKVFTNRKSYNFDETFLDRININMIFEQNNVFVLKERFMADIYTKSSDFKIDYGNKGIESRKRGFFLCEGSGSYDRDRIYVYSSSKKKDECSCKLQVY